MQHEINDICGAVKDLQVHRKFIIKAEVRITNMLTALMARMLGYDPNDEQSREKIWKRAQTAVKREFAGKPAEPDDGDAVAAIGAEINAMRLALRPIQTRRTEIETEMCRLAEMLGLSEFVAATKGFNLIGLAVIIGEAGNLSNYANVAKLWRRLGLGVAQGHEAKAYSTWRKEGDLSADDWTMAGYSPQRLGQIVGVVTGPLFQWKAHNCYGEVYARRREHTAVTHPEWTKKHSDLDARRVLTKAFIRDLWSEWRRAKTGMESVKDVPSAEIPQANVALQPRQGMPAERQREASDAVKPRILLPLSASNSHIREYPKDGYEVPA